MREVSKDNQANWEQVPLPKAVGQNLTHIPQVACRWATRSPDQARRSSILRPLRRTSLWRRLEQCGSSCESASFWPVAPVFQRDGRTCPAAFVQFAKVKNPWRISDGVGFIAGLCQRAIPIADNAPEWETLLLARKRTRVSLRDQVDAIHDKRLTLGKRSEVRGLHGLVVKKSEVDRLRISRTMNSHPKAENVAKSGHPGLMSAAEFGPSVGLRDHGNFISLIEAGHTPAVRHTNPETGREQYWLSAEEIASFHARFVTLTTLSDETGNHRNTLKSLLQASRGPRFVPSDQDFGPVFLREEAIKALR